MPEWRTWPGFAAYEVSDDGRIRRAIAKPGHAKGTILRITPDRYGYMRRALVGDDNRYHLVSVHIAVLEAFVGLRPSPGHDGSHLNGDKTDNSLANLLWEPRSENMRRKLGHGTLVHGEAHKCAKLTEEQVWEIRARKGERMKDIGSEFGVSGALVSRIQRGLAWPHLEERKVA